MAHPVMLVLTDIKWKFISPYFYAHLSLDVLFVLIWSVLITYPTVQEQHIYKLPEDIWRFVLQVCMTPFVSVSYCF